MFIPSAARTTRYHTCSSCTSFYVGNLLKMFVARGGWRWCHAGLWLTWICRRSFLIFPRGNPRCFNFLVVPCGSHRANPRWKGASSKGSPSFSPRIARNTHFLFRIPSWAPSMARRINRNSGVLPSWYRSFSYIPEASVATGFFFSKNILQWIKVHQHTHIFFQGHDFEIILRKAMGFPWFSIGKPRKTMENQRQEEVSRIVPASTPSTAASSPTSGNPANSTTAKRQKKTAICWSVSSQMGMGQYL